MPPNSPSMACSTKSGSSPPLLTAEPTRSGWRVASSGRERIPHRSTPTAFPAKAGIHRSTTQQTDKWVPAFAGNAVSLEWLLVAKPAEPWMPLVAGALQDRLGAAGLVLITERGHDHRFGALRANEGLAFP